MIDRVLGIYNFNVSSFSEKNHRAVRLANLLASLSFIISTAYSLFYLIFLESVRAAVVNEFFACAYLLHFFFLSRKELNKALLTVSVTYLAQMFYIVVFFASSRSGFQFYYMLAGPALYYFFRMESSIYKVGLTIVSFILFVLCELLGDRYAELVLSREEFGVLYFSTTAIVFVLLIVIIHTFQSEIDTRESKLEDAADSLSRANRQLSEEIRERVKAEKVIAESEKRFRTIFDQAAVGVSLTDTLTGKLIRVNKKYCEITGYSEERLKEMTFQDISHPGDLAKDLELMQTLVEGEADSFSMEKRYIRQDGSIVWVNLTVSPMWRDHGEERQHIAIIQDISQRKHLEAEVKTLQGIIPICSHCKRIRDDQGFWNRLESYIQSHSEAAFSHGICPDCLDELYGKETWYPKI